MTLCLVTGATGVIGPTLVNALLEKGYTVRVLVRSTPDSKQFPKEVEIARGDLSDYDALREAMRDVNIVFHLAAKLHINNPDKSLHAEYRRVNVEGTRLLLKAAQEAKVSRFVFFSSIAVYGPSKAGEIFTEETPTLPDTIYAETKCEAEKLTLAALDKNGKPFSVILRLAAVYGSVMKGNYPRLVNGLRKHRFFPVGKGENRRTLVHVKDVVSSAILVAENEKAIGEIYNVTDGKIHTVREIINAICKGLDRKPPKLFLPELPVRVAAKAFEMPFFVIGKRAPIGSATVEKLLEDVAVSGDKLQNKLGFQPELDLESGWKEAIEFSDEV